MRSLHELRVTAKFLGGLTGKKAAVAMWQYETFDTFPSGEIQKTQEYGKSETYLRCYRANWQKDVEQALHFLGLFQEKVNGPRLLGIYMESLCDRLDASPNFLPMQQFQIAAAVDLDADAQSVLIEYTGGFIHMHAETTKALDEITRSHVG